MAQMVKQTDYGEKIGQGINASLERLIHEKARKIEEKHRFERNLEFLKGAGIPNAEQVAHGSDEHILQLLKGKPVGTTINIGGQAGLSPYDQLFEQAEGLNQPMQQGQQSEQEIDYDNPTPEVYARPEVQQALQDYISQPEIQQQYGPELLAKVQQKLQSYAQQGPSRKEQILQPAMGQQAQPQQPASQEDLYRKMIASAQTPFQLNKAKAYQEAKFPQNQIEKLSPINEEFLKENQSASKYTGKLLPLINEAEDILHNGNYETGVKQSLKAKIDPALLSGDTQKLHNIFQSILTVQAQAESQGSRGSDLLRKMIAEGKLSIGSERKTLEHVLERIKNDIAHKSLVAEETNDILNTGKVPTNLAFAADKKATALKEKFDRLSDEKKVEYLLSNPSKFTYVRDIDFDGLRWVRDENNNWVRA